MTDFHLILILFSYGGVLKYWETSNYEHLMWVSQDFTGLPSAEKGRNGRAEGIIVGVWK